MGNNQRSRVRLPTKGGEERNQTRNRDPAFVGVQGVVAKHKEQIDSFEEWASSRRWDMFRKHNTVFNAPSYPCPWGLHAALAKGGIFMY
jgi:hypothetical protein